MNILVTGGGGFIGSHLVEQLLEHGHGITVLDNFSTGKRANLPETHPRLRIVAGDVRDAEQVAGAASGQDAIVHLAAVASVQASVEQPLETHQVNLVGTLNLLEAARKQDIAKFVYASSAAVYGNTRQLPVAEEDPLSPLTPYAADKLAGEYYLDFYRRQFALETTILRFFNIFGPRQDPSSPYSGVISIFMQRAIAGQPLTVFGDGEQSRDFVYVADLVRLLTEAVERAEGVPVAMNVGSNRQTTLNQLLDAIRRFSGKTLEVSYSDPRPGDIRHSRARNDRVREIMGYREHYSVDEGLNLTYDWYLRNQAEK